MTLADDQIVRVREAMIAEPRDGFVLIAVVDDGAVVAAEEDDRVLG